MSIITGFHFYLCDTPTFLLFHAGRYLSQNFHFYICDTLKLPFFVSCWQVSDVRKKKKGMVNDVSVSNISYESII